MKPPRLLRTWSALLPLLAAGGLPALACDPAGPADRTGEAVPAPPRPEDPSLLDPRVVQRIQVALEALEADPGSARAWAELGFVYGAERLREFAAECFHEAGQLDPREPRWPYHESVTRSQLGQPEEAIAAMERSLALEPGYAPSHARLGGYRLDLGELDAAERSFRRATELDASYPGGRVGLARVHLQRDENAQAIALLEDLQAQDPSDATFRQLLAVARRQAGTGGEPAAEDVLVENEIPVWNDPWEEEARGYRENPTLLRVGRALEAGRPEDALRLIEEARAGGSTPDDTALQAASAYLELGRLPEAHAELDGFLLRRPENTGAQLLLAKLCEREGDREGAVRALVAVTRAQPTHGGAFAAQGRLLASLDRFPEAEQALQRAIELGVDGAELRYAQGQALQGMRRFEEALEVYEQLTRSTPDHADAWLQLAVVRNRLDDYAGCDRALARAEELGGGTPAVRAFAQRSIAQVRERKARRAAGEDPRQDSGEDPPPAEEHPPR